MAHPSAAGETRTLHPLALPARLSDPGDSELRRGLYVDCETTGFSPEHDAVIERSRTARRGCGCLDDAGRGDMRYAIKLNADIVPSAKLERTNDRINKGRLSSWGPAAFAAVVRSL